MTLEQLIDSWRELARKTRERAYSKELRHSEFREILCARADTLDACARELEETKYR